MRLERIESVRQNRQKHDIAEDVQDVIGSPFTQSLISEIIRKVKALASNQGDRMRLTDRREGFGLMGRELDEFPKVGGGTSSHGVTSSAGPVARVERRGTEFGTGCSSQGVTSSRRPVTIEEPGGGCKSHGVTSATGPVESDGRARIETGELLPLPGVMGDGVSNESWSYRLFAVDGRRLGFGLF